MHFFRDVRLKSSMAHNRSVTFDYFCDLFVFKPACEELSGSTKSFRLLQFSWRERVIYLNQMTIGLVSLTRVLKIFLKSAVNEEEKVNKYWV